MGLFDFIKDAGERILGIGDDDKVVQETKPLSEHLKQNGVDPTDVSFEFGADGEVTINGRVDDWESREKAVLIVGNVAGISRVNDNLMVGAAVAEADTEAAGAQTTALGDAGASEDEWRSRTYTVQSGDTLSKIAKEMYGDAGKYPVIFEANKPMLSDPDKIYPGQVLRIPNES